MALKDNAVLVIDTGNYFLAEPGTAAPANLLEPGAEWDNVGHTSLEDILGLGSEGGEATILGTLQSKSLRTSYSARTETMTFTLQQFDEDSLKLYFGRNMDYIDGDKRFMGVPETPQPTVAAFLIIFVDQEEHFAFYVPRAEILRGDDMEFGETGAIMGLPLSVSPKKHGANKWAWALTPIGNNPMATGATAGKPGTFTPSGATPPYSESSLATVTASPSAAWATGQYIVIGNSTEHYWDGSSWQAGRAI